MDKPLDEVLIPEVVRKAVCPQCDKLLDINAENYYLTKGYIRGDQPFCKPCTQRNNANGTSLRNRQALRAATKELLKNAKQDRMNCPHVSEIAAGMIKKFDGVEKFCNEWFNQIRDAEDGSKTRLDQCYTIVKMVAGASQEVDRQVETMTDIELSAATAVIAVPNKGLGVRVRPLSSSTMPIPV